MTLKRYRSLPDAIHQIRKRGFTLEFEFKDGKVISIQDRTVYKTSEVSIVEIHRFNSLQSHVVFVIEAVDGKAGYNIMQYEEFTKPEVISIVNSIRVKEENIY